MASNLLYIPLFLTLSVNKEAGPGICICLPGLQFHDAPGPVKQIQDPTLSIRKTVSLYQLPLVYRSCVDRRVVVDGVILTSLYVCNRLFSTFNILARSPLTDSNSKNLDHTSLSSRKSLDINLIWQTTNRQTLQVHCRLLTPRESE